jgi:hypothetical protein
VPASDIYIYIYIYVRDPGRGPLRPTVGMTNPCSVHYPVNLRATRQVDVRARTSTLKLKGFQFEKLLNAQSHPLQRYLAHKKHPIP